MRACQNPVDIFRLNLDDLKPLERFAQKSAENLSAIEQSKEINLTDLFIL